MWWVRPEAPETDGSRSAGVSAAQVAYESRGVVGFRGPPLGEPSARFLVLPFELLDPLAPDAAHSGDSRRRLPRRPGDQMISSKAGTVRISAAVLYRSAGKQRIDQPTVPAGNDCVR